MKKYVFPTLDDLNDGCGVIVGNLFVTAAHVVEHNSFYLPIDDKTIELKKEDAILYRHDETVDGADIAVFRLDEYSSPLEFDTTQPEIGMQLDSISYEHVVEGKPCPTNVFSAESSDWLELRECQATIEELHENFFLCHTSMVLKKGSSGSPVFRDGKVFGILHGGKPGEPVCLFQSAASIVKLLNQKKKED